MNPIDRQIGQRLHDIREAAGFSIPQFASAIGVDADTLAAIEAGTQRLRPAPMMRATSVLGIKVAALFDVVSVKAGPEASEALRP